jgi:hypothetical protein
VVSGLSECLTAALNQAIPTLVANLDPIAKAKAAAGGAQSKQPPAVEARDPAYAQITQDLYLFDALNLILNSPSGVDWKSTEVTKEQPKSLISFILTMLDDSLTSFSNLASNRAPSIQYKQILTDAVKVSLVILILSNYAKVLTWSRSHRKSYMSPRRQVRVSVIRNQARMTLWSRSGRKSLRLCTLTLMF